MQANQILRDLKWKIPLIIDIDRMTIPIDQVIGGIIEEYFPVSRHALKRLRLAKHLYIRRRWHKGTLRLGQQIKHIADLRAERFLSFASERIQQKTPTVLSLDIIKHQLSVFRLDRTQFNLA